MLFKIKSNPKHPLSGALPFTYVPARVAGLVVSFLSSAAALCLSRCLFRTILVTLCLMVWDWRVSRAEPMFSCWHDLLFLFVSYCFSFSSFHGMVVSGTLGSLD